MEKIENLSDRHLRIFEYVRNNQGVSKEEVVRGMRGNPSRITVLNVLKDLENFELIVARKEKPNSQIYQLYINSNDLMSAVLSELNIFKNSYFVLLNKAKEMLAEQEKIIHEHHDDWAVERIELKTAEEILSALFSTYSFMTNTYLIIGLTKWREEAKDRETFSKLLSLVFMVVQEIQTNIFDCLTPSYVFENDRSYLVRSMCDIDLAYFSTLVRKFEWLELEKEFEPIMDIIWKKSYDFMNFEIYHGMKRKEKFKDWRKAVNYYHNNIRPY